MYWGIPFTILRNQFGKFMIPILTIKHLQKSSDFTQRVENLLTKWDFESLILIFWVGCTNYCVAQFSNTLNKCLNKTIPLQTLSPSLIILPTCTFTLSDLNLVMSSTLKPFIHVGPRNCISFSKQELKVTKLDSYFSKQPNSFLDYRQIFFRFLTCGPREKFVIKSIWPLKFATLLNLVQVCVV